MCYLSRMVLFPISTPYEGKKGLGNFNRGLRGFARMEGEIQRGFNR
jgi:hypothetical protein